MRTRETCLTHAFAAAALPSLHAVEVTAGQNQEQWMVFDRDSARPCMPTSAMSGHMSTPTDRP